MNFDNEEIIALINKKKLFIFDFDGVIADSIDIKTNAFFKMYSRYGDKIAKKVIEYHKSNGGMSRFEKFKFFQEKLLNQPINSFEIDMLSKEFSNIVIQDVIHSPEINGSTEFIMKYCANNNCDINSATPQEEIETIVKKRGIRKFFRNVFGSPSSKYDNLLKSINKSDKSDAIFIGDAEADLFASKQIGIDFLGIGENIQSKIDKNNGSNFAVKNFLSLNND